MVYSENNYATRIIEENEPTTLIRRYVPNRTGTEPNRIQNIYRHQGNSDGIYNSGIQSEARILDSYNDPSRLSRIVQTDYALPRSAYQKLTSQPYDLPGSVGKINAPKTKVAV